MMSYVKLPELVVDTSAILQQVVSAEESEWELLDWGQHILRTQDYSFVCQHFSEHVKLYITPAMVMRFGPGTGLPIHKDNLRKAVIQIPLSENCKYTPTYFYNEEQQYTSKIEWLDNSAWMFDTHSFHKVENNSNENRYMMYIPFFKQSYTELLNLYECGMFFK